MQYFLQQRGREAVQRKAEGIVAAARGTGQCAIPLTGEEACLLLAQSAAACLLAGRSPGARGRNRPRWTPP